jgi:hypothetical protein
LRITYKTEIYGLGEISASHTAQIVFFFSPTHTVPDKYPSQMCRQHVS